MAALVAWLIAGAVSVALLAVAVVGLIRRLKILGQASTRLGREVTPLLATLRAESDRATAKLEQLPGKLPGRGAGGRIRR